jgi:hypothetical protein
MNIKNLFLFLFLSFGLGINLNAQQQYKHCLDDGVVKWSIAAEVIDAGLQSKEYVSYGDTLINGILYKKIYEENFRQTSFNGSDAKWINYIPDYNWMRNIFIRESEDASKLYARDIYKEFLISDLNLQKGDEFRIPGYSGDFSALVDSVYTKEGLKHVQLDFVVKLGYQYRKLIFIEGVGPNVGIYYFMGFDEYVLSCFQNQTLFYKYERSEYSDYPCGYCYSSVSISDISGNDYSLIIKKDKIEINFLDNTDKQISIYDISGRLLYSEDFFAESHVIIPNVVSSKGVYLLKIFKKNSGKTDTHKFII